MHDDDRSTGQAIEARLQAATAETARVHRERDAIEADLMRVAELFLRHAGRRDLAVDFLNCLGNPRGTLH